MSNLIRTMTQTAAASIAAIFLCTSTAFADPAAAPDAATSVPPAADSVAAQCSGPQCDVPTGSWAYEAVAQLIKDGIIVGYPDGTFKGERPMTRYEAAELAYRAINAIQSYQKENKPVTQADLDAVSSLIATFGSSLNAVSAHVDKLQKEADTTKGQLAQLSDQVNRSAQIHGYGFFRAYSYNVNIQANCGPGAYAGGAVGSQQAYCAKNGGGAALAHGTKTAGWGPSYFADPPGQNLAVGQHGQGLGGQYVSFLISGHPTDYTSYFMTLTSNIKYDTNLSTSTASPAFCYPSGNFLSPAPANAAAAGACSSATAGQGAYASGAPFQSVTIGSLWFQQSSKSGLYYRVGHMQENEGPKNLTPAWLLTDYFYGAWAGYRDKRFNAYLAYGFDDATGTNTTLWNTPSQAQVMVGEADYQLDHGRTDIGMTYTNYSGVQQSLWDPSAVICTGPAGATKLFANTTAVPFTTCGAGFAPITYTNGAAITGAYLSAQNNNLPGNPTPGLSINNPESQIGLFGVFNYGKARVYLAGSDKLGNDPYTGQAWNGALSGFYQIDYGPYYPHEGNRNKFTFESTGFAAQFNSVTPALSTFSGPVQWAYFSTNWSGEYFLDGGLKYWLSDHNYASLFYAHSGLLPNTLLPAGGAACPGCVVSGDSRNAVYGELFVDF